MDNNSICKPDTRKGPGQHSLEFRATDHVGHQKALAPFTVHVSTTAPDNGGSPDPTGGTLPDGTPVIGSPTPITIIPPGGGGLGSGALPVVSAVTFSPASPVGRGPVTVTIRFSKPMNNTADPSVTFRTPGSAAGLPVTETHYVNDTWTGVFTITAQMNSGTATLLVHGAQDPAGNLVADSLTTFQTAIVLPAAPVALQAQAVAAHAQLTWSAGAGPAPAGYNLYSSTAPIISRAGLTPLETGIGAANAVDSPSPDSPFTYYVVTAVDAQNGESALSNVASMAMPLPPLITAPANNANVDVSSINIQGLAQAGALVDLSTGTFGGALVTVTAAADGTWLAHLTLGSGPFLIQARARSAVTTQISPAAAVSIHASILPTPPANIQDAAGDTTITLSWDPVTQLNLAGINIYRDGSARPLNAQPLPVTQSSYQDIALTDGRSYTYLMTTIRLDGIESYPSAIIQSAPVAGPQWGNP